MGLNHPETIFPPPVRGKIVFHETSPWCYKSWGLPRASINETVTSWYMCVQGIALGLAPLSNIALVCPLLLDLLKAWHGYCHLSSTDF